MGSDCTEDIKCVWCGKVYPWDWCQDVIPGMEPVEFACTQVPNTKLYLYLCGCGGSLCVVTEEPNGSEVMRSVPE